MVLTHMAVPAQGFQVIQSVVVLAEILMVYIKYTIAPTLHALVTIPVQYLATDGTPLRRSKEAFTLRIVVTTVLAFLLRFFWRYCYCYAKFLIPSVNITVR